MDTARAAKAFFGVRIILNFLYLKIQFSLLDYNNIHNCVDYNNCLLYFCQCFVICLFKKEKIFDWYESYWRYVLPIYLYDTKSKGNIFVGSLKHPLIAPVSTYDEYIEEEPTVVGYSVSSNRRNDKSMNLSKLDELNQVGKDRASNHFLNNAKKLISFLDCKCSNCRRKSWAPIFLILLVHIYHHCSLHFLHQNNDIYYCGLHACR